MITPDEKDVIGEVCREDAADRASKVSVIACKVDESCGQKLQTERFGIVPDMVYGHDKFGRVCKETEGEIYVREKAFNELRQQLDDVSHERDLLRSAGQWVSIEDRMPELGQECLIRIPVLSRYAVEGSEYKGDGQWIGAFCSTRGKDKYYKVTHWMPLPAAPSAEQKS